MKYRKFCTAQYSGTEICERLETLTRDSLIYKMDKFKLNKVKIQTLKKLKLCIVINDFKVRLIQVMSEII